MIQVLRETKEAPTDIQERIARAGGRNFYGRPNFRIVWGRNIHAGEPDSAYPLAEPDRWYIERWVAPDVCGTSGGEYVLCDDSGLLGQRLPDTGVICNFLLPLIERSRGISYAERQRAINAREARLDRAAEQRGFDAFDDAAPAFGGAAHSGPIGPAKSFEERAAEIMRRQPLF